jgi:hypothetical protein
MWPNVYTYKPRGLAMTKPIRVTGVFNKELQIRLYVLALIELARQLQQEEEQAAHSQLPTPEPARAEDSADD